MQNFIRSRAALSALLVSAFLTAPAAAFADEGTPDYSMTRMTGGLTYEGTRGPNLIDDRYSLSLLGESHSFQYDDDEQMYLRNHAYGRVDLGVSSSPGATRFAASTTGTERFSIGFLPTALQFGNCRPFVGGTVPTSFRADLVVRDGKLDTGANGSLGVGGEAGLACVIGDVSVIGVAAGGVRFFDRGDGRSVAPWAAGELALRWGDNLTTHATGEHDGGIDRGVLAISTSPEALGGVTIGLEGELSRTSNQAVAATLDKSLFAPLPGDPNIYGQRLSLTVGGAF